METHLEERPTQTFQCSIYLNTAGDLKTANSKTIRTVQNMQFEDYVVYVRTI